MGKEAFGEQSRVIRQVLKLGPPAYEADVQSLRDAADTLEALGAFRKKLLRIANGDQPSEEQLDAIAAHIADLLQIPPKRS